MELVPIKMRQWFSTLMFVFFYASSSFSQITSNPLTQELLKLEQALNDGIKNHDTLALKQLLHGNINLQDLELLNQFPGTNGL